MIRLCIIFLFSSSIYLLVSYPISTIPCWEKSGCEREKHQSSPDYDTDHCHWSPCQSVSVRNISCCEGVFSLTAELVPEVRKHYQFRLETRVECSNMGVSYECPNNIGDVMFAWVSQYLCCKYCWVAAAWELIDFSQNYHETYFCWE